eukprot:COSAG01_NODE_1390_length_10496_cov_8.535116_7_plen_83_part_00
MLCAAAASSPGWRRRGRDDRGVYRARRPCAAAMRQPLALRGGTAGGGVWRRAAAHSSSRASLRRACAFSRAGPIVNFSDFHD